MAAVLGVNYQKTQNTPRDLVDAKELKGRVRVTYDTYEAAALSAADTIGVGVLPKGAVFLGFEIHHDALGTGVTLALGDSGDTDRYLAAAAAATAGVLSTEDAAIGGIGYEMTADTLISILTGGAAATGTIKIKLYWSID